MRLQLYANQVLKHQVWHDTACVQRARIGFKHARRLAQLQHSAGLSSSACVVRHELQRQPARCAQPLRWAPLWARQAAVHALAARCPAAGEEHKLPYKRVPGTPCGYQLLSTSLVSTERTGGQGARGNLFCTPEKHLLQHTLHVR